MAQITFGGAPINSLDSTTTTLTEDSSTTNTESSNLNNRSLASRWISTGTSGQLEIDLGSTSVSMGAIGIIHSLSTVGTLRIRADNSTTFTSTELIESTTADIWTSTGYTNNKQGLRLYLFNGVDAGSTSDTDPKRRYLLLNFNDTGSTGVEVSRILVSEPIEFSGGFRYGHNLGMNDLSVVQLNAWGRLFAEDRSRQDTVSVTMHNLTKDDAFQKLKQKLMRQMGTHGEMMVRLLPDDTEFEEEQTFYCRFRSMPTLVSVATPKMRYAAGIVLEELL